MLRAAGYLALLVFLFGMVLNAPGELGTIIGGFFTGLWQVAVAIIDAANGVGAA
jgi:hypothetical protein